MSLKYQIVPVTVFQQNCSLLWCEESRQAALIDPGGESERLIDVIERQGVVLSKILLTHGHLDHVGAARELADHYQVPIIGPHHEDKFLFDALREQSFRFGFPECTPFLPDSWLKEGERVSIGNFQLSVLFCPGHTPGHIVFFCQEMKLAWVGDVLFYGSIGRTDFPRGNHQQLIDSIRTKLWPLGDDVTFIPGHGPSSTIGNERLHNPFVGQSAAG